MAEYTVSVEVNRPIDHAWDVFMDESKTAQWLTGFKRMEIIEGEPLTVGSRHKMVFEEDGSELVFVETVRVIQPPKEFSFDFDHEFMGSTLRVTLESVAADRTLLSCHTNVKATEVLTEEQLASMTPDMKKRQMRNFENLKTLIESS